MSLFVKKSQKKKNDGHFLNCCCCSFKSKIPVGIKAGSSNKVSPFSLSISALCYEIYHLLLDGSYRRRTVLWLVGSGHILPQNPIFPILSATESLCIFFTVKLYTFVLRYFNSVFGTSRRTTVV